ncbi:uncharacterized protein LOC119680300 isoform X2 [Teleopsis dalmanni]|uniref:uncharacterized protein LOC119680300 isoform X2 n=1 Tax=Teleopsis dalmanni TaxID=139649 RepID=UPI0018CFA41E|nr:uncharacterized protein LOC119680300 isoform X2 [Teleopsis dalmanni]
MMVKKEGRTRCLDKKHVYSFRNSWLEEPQFQGWLQKISEGGTDVAFCLFCNQKIVAHKKVLLRHIGTQKHQENSIVKVFENDEEKEGIEVQVQDVHTGKAAAYCTQTLKTEKEITELDGTKTKIIQIGCAFEDPLCEYHVEESVIPVSNSTQSSAVTEQIPTNVSSNTEPHIVEKIKAETRYFNEMAELARAKRNYIELQTKKIKLELRSIFNKRD